MNQIVNKVLLAGDKFMHGIHKLNSLILHVEHLLEITKNSKIHANRRYKLYLQE